MDTNFRQYCTFYVDHLYLGIEVQQVQEVIRHQKMTAVPLAPPAIAGLINLRGQIVTAIDLRYPLGLPPRREDTLPMNIVVQDGESVVSLLVDRIGDVVDVGQELFEPPPCTLQDSFQKFILGAYKLPNQLLIILNTQLVLEVEHIARSGNFADQTI
jgi:purine-binding chemotaxis protein CheW